MTTTPSDLLPPRPLGALDIDAATAAALRVRNTAREALRTLMPLSTDQRPNSALATELSWDDEAVDYAVLTRTFAWNAVADEAVRLWTTPIMSFLVAERSLAIDAAATLLEGHLVRQIHGPLLQEIRDATKINDHDAAVDDWRAAAQNSAAERNAELRYTTIREAWSDGDHTLEASDWEPLLMRTITAAIREADADAFAVQRDLAKVVQSHDANPLPPAFTLPAPARRPRR